MRETVLRHLARVCALHYRWVFTGVTLLVAAVALLFILKPPHIDSDILALLPQKNPVVQDFRETTADFKSLDYLFVLLETREPKEHPIEQYEDFADAFAGELRKNPSIEGVEYRLQDYEPLLREMLPYTLLYLKPADLSDVAGRFSDVAILAQAESNRKLLSNPASLVTKQLIQYDPFGLFPVLKRNFMGKTRQLKVDLSDGYYISHDGAALLMIVRPARPAQDIPFGKELLTAVRSAEADLRGRWVQEGGEDPSFLRVKYGGGYPIAQGDANLIKRDAIINTVTSVVLVMFVFLWAFRRKSSLAYGWLPLLFGMVLAFGVAHLLGVTLNSATAGFAAILVGLGIDFSTVMYGRYIEERNRGIGVEESINSIMGNAGKGVMVGAVTTAGTFGAMLLTQFQGMRQIGLFTGLGILFCAASVFVFLPAMLYFHHLHHTRKGSEPSFHMHGFGFDRLARWAHRNPKVTLGIGGILTLLLGVAAMGVRLEDNIQNLRSPKNEGINVSADVAQKFGATLTYMMVVVEGSSPDEIVSKSGRVLEAVEPYRKAGDVLFTDSIATYLPPAERQAAVLAEVERGQGGIFSYDRIHAAFLTACNRSGFDAAYFKPYMQSLQRMLDPSGPVTYAELAKGSLAPILRKFIVEKSPGRYRGVVYLYIPEEFKRFEPQGLMDAVQREVPGAKVAGINLLSRILRYAVKKDALKAFLVGMFVVCLIIFLDFRRFRPAIYSLVPLGVGLVWMLGTLRLMGESMNMMNIFVTTLILGIGSDYGIHFVHRYLEDDGHHMERVIKEAGSPIAIAALTTVAGFGSMSISSYPGLRSIGYVSLLGSVYCMLATLTVLVALLTLAEKRGRDDGTKAG